MPPRAASLPLVVLLLASGCLGAAVEPPAEANLSAATAQEAAFTHVPEGAPVGEAPAVHARGLLRASGVESFEPTLGVTTEGVLFLSTFHWAPGARVPVVEASHVVRSADAGLTWEDVTPRTLGHPMPPNDNDPYVHVDAETGRVFVSSSQVAACTVLSWSDDLGATWTTNPLGCGATPGVHDHQTLWTGKPRAAATQGYPNLVWMCVNRLVGTGCATSLDGGKTFGPYNERVWTLESMAEVKFKGLTGHGVSAPDGTAYIAGAPHGMPALSRSDDDGATWNAFLISDMPAGGAAVGHEVKLAVDAAGVVYAAWIGADRKPYLAASRDRGETWGEPRMVAPPDVGTTDYPALVAGDAGRVAFAYYGSPVDKPYEEFEEGDAWNAYLTILLDAATPGSPVHTVMLNAPDDPMARGRCGGERCANGDTNGVGDFIGMTLDAEGRPWVALVDACHDGCPKHDRKQRIGIGGVGTLAEGPRLRGEGTLPRLD